MAQARLISTDFMETSHAMNGHPATDTCQRSLEMGKLFFEKCELAHARDSYSQALSAAQLAGDLRLEMEALSGLLRLAGEALDLEKIREFQQRLDDLMKRYPRAVPPMAWYCKGAIERHLRKPRTALFCFHRYLRALRAGRSQSQTGSPESEVRGWMMVAACLMDRGRLKRAEQLTLILWKRYQQDALPTVNGTLQLILGHLAERKNDWDEALECYRKAYAAFLAERNWLLHLYAILGNARVARAQQNFPQAYFQLDLIERVASGPEFGALRREIALEKERLQEDAVDLMIDRDTALVRVRELGEVSFRKQFVLLGILEELSAAHLRGDTDHGVSKGELIERVWKEKYRPEAHDNKLYYNINRLRKLIEPDHQKPRYLLNSREGYRLAPGLRVQLLKQVQAGVAGK